MAGRGRPTRLTKERKERIVQAVAAGNYVETSARFAGISETTFYNWMRRGQEEGASANLVEFVAAVQKALAEAEVRNVTLIQTAATSQWQAAAWLLERKHPAQWGRRLEVAGVQDAPIQHEVVHRFDYDAYEREFQAVIERESAKRLPAPSGNGTEQSVDNPHPER